MVRTPQSQGADTQYLRLTVSQRTSSATRSHSLRMFSAADLNLFSLDVDARPVEFATPRSNSFKSDQLRLLLAPLAWPEERKASAKPFFHRHRLARVPMFIRPAWQDWRTLVFKNLPNVFVLPCQRAAVDSEKASQSAVGIASA